MSDFNDVMGSFPVKDAALTTAQIADPRNVIDQFKNMDEDIIIGEQMKRRIPLVSIALNLTKDFNKATVLRTHSGVAGQHFYFLNRDNPMTPDNPEGAKKYIRTGTVGTHHYNTISHYAMSRWTELFDDLRAQGYLIVAVEHVAGYEPEIVYDVELPKKTAFIIGEEAVGIPVEVLDTADKMVFLPMLGVSPRSYNASVAHGGVVFEYMRQHRDLIV